MQYIKGMQFYQNDKKTAITLGKFDGLHRGHETLIERVIEHQKNDGVDSVVFAFDMAPLYEKIKKKKESLITNEERAGRLFGRVDYLVECPFVEAVSKIEAETFIKEILVKQFHAEYIVVGTDFHFGYQKKGDYHMLQQYSGEYGYEVEVIEKKCYEDREISSTYIKEEVKKGNMKLVIQLLGYPYTVTGEVQYGKQLGRKLGFPTMNIVAEKEKLLPPNGVYVSSIRIDGMLYGGISNIGCKPTVSEKEQMGIETFVFDYHGDAYGKKIEVALYEYVRPEKKFDSVEMLREQVEQDIAYGRKRLQGFDSNF